MFELTLIGMTLMVHHAVKFKAILQQGDKNVSRVFQWCQNKSLSYFGDWKRSRLNHVIITNNIHLLGNINIAAFFCNAPQQLNQEDPCHPWVIHTQSLSLNNIQSHNADLLWSTDFSECGTELNKADCTLVLLPSLPQPPFSCRKAGAFLIKPVITPVLIFPVVFDLLKISM